MHFNQLKRREFITLLAGAALIGPPTAIAQKPKVYRLGTLTAGPPMSPASGDGAVLIGALTQRGYTLGQNLTCEARGVECALDSGQFQAAVLTGCWAWRSSYCAGLR